MALLQKLKSILGLGGSDRDSGERREVGVTVEREGGDRSGAGADAGDGTGTAATSGGADSTAETDGPRTDAAGAVEADEPATEDTADAATADPDDDATEEAADAGEEHDEETADGDEPTEGDDLEDIKGVGPAYAQRLRDAGVGSVAELADADADELAAETDLSANRIGNWIEQAEAR